MLFQLILTLNPFTEVQQGGKQPVLSRKFIQGQSLIEHQNNIAELYMESQTHFGLKYSCQEWETDCIGNLVTLELLKKGSVKKLSMLRIRGFVGDCSLLSVSTLQWQRTPAASENVGVLPFKGCCEGEAEKRITMTISCISSGIEKHAGVPSDPV